MSFNLAIAQLSESDLLFLMKNGKRSSSLNGFDFESLIHFSFKFLKETLPDLIKKGNFERLFIEAFRERGIFVFYPDINRLDYNDMMYHLFWILDELTAIAKMEKEYLSSDADNRLVAAGIHHLDQFGNLNLIDSLAGGDILKWQEVQKLPYSVIFDKQYKTIIEANIQRKLAKIK